MRLTCPNCGAQYEVPDDVIPRDGRDVQCSNCGTTWFQPHPDAEPLEAAAADPEEVQSALEDLGEAPPAQTPEADARSDEDDLPDQVPTRPEPERRKLDPEVSGILQEEAEHERRQRDAEAGLETQPDLGLDDTADDAERRAREARERMERLKGPQQTDDEMEEAVAAAAAAAMHSRRDRLPDIDEINSSLRRSGSPLQADETPDEDLRDAPRKSGFARGFAIPLIVIVVLILLYANAPRIVEAVPALGPAMNSYVLIVDQVRTWLDGVITSFMP